MTRDQIDHVAEYLSEFFPDGYMLVGYAHPDGERVCLRHFPTQMSADAVMRLLQDQFEIARPAAVELVTEDEQ